MNNIMGKLFKKTKYIQLKPNEMTAFEKNNSDTKLAQSTVSTLNCKQCQKPIDAVTLIASDGVCPFCNYHSRLNPVDRILQLADKGSFVPLFETIVGENPLDFPQYESKLQKEQDKTGRTEAVTTGICRIGGYVSAIAVMDSTFMMGSMGTAVGERITQLIDYAESEKLPLVILTASGGARMQEGIFSLMQMAKTSIALSQFNRSGGLYISVLTDPTTGGVTASFAMLGDIILAEPGALIGFAGPRVIEQTIRQKLPEGFQTSEFLLAHGYVDRIVPRNQLNHTIGLILSMHGGQRYEDQASC